MARTKKLHKTLPVFARVLRRFAPQMRKQRKLITGSVGILVAEVFLRLLEPWPLSFIIDYMIAPVDGREGTLGFVSRDLTPTVGITLAASALVAFTALRALSRYLSSVGFALIGNRLIKDVRTDLFRHVHELSLRFHVKSRSGDLLIRVIGDVGRMRDVVITALLPLAGNLLILVGMVSICFWMHWQLALIAASTAPLFWLTTVRINRSIHEVARKQRKREGRMASTIAESIGGIETVQALSLGDRFAEKLGRQSNKSLKEGAQGRRLAARLERTVAVLNALSQALVLWFGAHAVLRGELSTGELLVFLSYLRSAFRPIRNFAKYSARIAKASAAGERVLELLDTEPEVRNRPDAVVAKNLNGAVRFEKVDFSYDAGQPILQGIDLEIKPGQRIALVGPSGSGKSTLLSLIPRLFDPTLGRVLIDERDLRDYTIESLRAQTSIVLQNTVLFAASIRENIACGAKGASDSDVAAAVRLACAEEFILALPDGLDTNVGERGLTLSRGQRQRIALARAAIRPSPLLLLDEPLSGLDEESEAAVLGALEQIQKGRTTILVTHDLRHAARCDQIVVLDQGQIRERGTPEELMALGGRFARLAQAGARTESRPMRGRHAVAG